MGRVSDFERDRHERLLAVHYPDESRECYTYDAHHLLVACWDGRAQRAEYAYDARAHDAGVVTRWQRAGVARLVFERYKLPKVGK